MRWHALLLAAGCAAQAPAQSIVSSPAPEHVGVTLYRDAERGLRPFDLGWLGGYALVSETRRVSLPAGLTELRFEGVTSGIVPQSAIVTGLGPAVLEKNRDARLLSPGSLISAYLGERVLLKRTSRVTGETRHQDAIVRSSGDGVLVETEQGIEALRCTGLPETLVVPRVPADLSAKPTLSVLVRSPQPVEANVTLSYISNNFDWQANYVGKLSRDGRKLELFAWLTLANGDDTGLKDAATQAVAGKLNRERVWVQQGEAPPIRIHCWPSGTTSDIGEEEAEEIVVTGRRIPVAAAMMAPPPPPPPPPAPERDEGAAMIAQEERLGDVRLYRIPEPVTVSARSQKQVAFLQQPSVRVESLYRLRPVQQEFESPLERVLVSRNAREAGLGLPLPAGRLALFAEYDGRRILLGEGNVDDHSVGEKVELTVGIASATRARQTVIPAGDHNDYLLTIANAAPERRIVEVELPLEAKAVGGGKLVKRDGWMLWRVRIRPNGTVRLRYRL